MLNTKDLIGLPEKDAIAKIKASGMKARVRRRDQKYFIGTMDLRNDRMNLEIDNGKVVKAHIG